MTDLEKELLETLSFYTPMTKEKILMELDEVSMRRFSHLTLDDLDRTLILLGRKKFIRVIRAKNFRDHQYIRVFKRRSKWRSLFGNFFGR